MLDGCGSLWSEGLAAWRVTPVTCPRYLLRRTGLTGSARPAAAAPRNHVDVTTKWL